MIKRAFSLYSYRIFQIILCLICIFISLPMDALTLENKDEGPMLRDLSAPSYSEKGTLKVNSKESPIEITVQEAVMMALENNRALEVERLNPVIMKTYEEQEAAVFDPKIDAGASSSKEEAHLAGQPLSLSSESDSANIDLSVSKLFPYGTDISIDIDTGRTNSDRYDRRYESRVGLSVTQSLLKGKGMDVNLARLRQAQLNTSYSEYELRGFSESLISEVEISYWNYLLAGYRINIYKKSMQLAEQQLEETKEIISVGKLAETEMIAAKAELALRRQELIDAQNVMAAARLKLIRLLNPDGKDYWDREILLMDEPFMPSEQPDSLEDHINLALRMRPEINQTKLSIQRHEIEIVKTKNGILPKMDLFVSLGKTGYAASFGSSIGNIGGDTYDLMAGIRAEFPFHNRDSNAIHQRALLTKRQTLQALDNLSQLVELDVRLAHIELNRARQQIEASTATRQIEEEKVRIETEKFRVGKSTSFLVAQAQRDLVRSQIDEVNAIVGNLKALVNLYKLDGSLLARRGIEAPGKDPVTLSTE